MADAPRGFGEQLFQRLQGKGLSRAQIYKALALQRLTEEVMELGTEGKLQEGALVEISKINSSARQKQLAEIAVGCRLEVPWVKELARLIRNAEKTASDKEANKYWDFFFEVKDALERDGGNEELLARVRNFSVTNAQSSEQNERTVVEFKKFDLLAGRGLDVGTSNIVASAQVSGEERERILYNISRNAFLDVRNDTFTKKMLMKLGIEHIVHGDKGYVIGDPAFELANIFEKNTRRPMKDGMISPVEREALTVVSLIIGQLLGPPQRQGEICSFSVPAEPIDADRNVVYHRGALETVLKKLGYDPKPMVEGHCVVMGEMESDDYTGVGISCGAGMFNVCIAYKSVPALAFSTSRGGDWIDNNVAQALGYATSQVCAVKESGVDLNRPRDRVEDAIVIYYRELIRYSLESIRQKFETAQNMPSFPDPVPIVCAGGTSMIKGYIDVFREEFRRVNFPIDVKEIRLAKDPLYTVSRGCCVDALEETKARSRVEQEEKSANLGRAAISKVEKGTRRIARESAPLPAIIEAPPPPPPPPPPPRVEEPVAAVPRPRETRLLKALPPPPPQPRKETRSIARTAPKKVEPAKPLPEQRRSEQQVVVRPAVKLPDPDPEPRPAAPSPEDGAEPMEVADFGSDSEVRRRDDASDEPAPPPPKKEEPEDFPLIS